MHAGGSIRRPWSYAVAVAALVACGDGPSELRDAPVVWIRGQVHTTDGSPIPTVSIRVGRADYQSTTMVDADGRFAIRAPSAGDSFDILIEASGGRYHPSLRRVAPLDTDWNDVDVLLVPNRWTIAGGLFAGREVADLSLDVAFAPENGDRGALYVAYNGFAPTAAPPRAWRFTVAFPPSAFPLPLYFLHDGIGRDGLERAAITPEDSATLWSVVDDLEARVGMDLFRPALEADLPADTLPLLGNVVEIRPFSVSLQVVPELAVAGLGGASVVCHTEHPSAGDEGCARYGTHTLVFGGVTLAALSGSQHDRYVAQHELIHALGFGHACHLPTVMRPCDGTYPERQYPEPGGGNAANALDVAYIQLHRALHDRTVELDPEFGVREALDGERSVVLLKPRLAADWPLATPVATPVGPARK